MGRTRKYDETEALQKAMLLIWRKGFEAVSTRDLAAAMGIKSAYQNQVESAAYAVPVLAVAALVDLQSAGAQLAAMLLVVGRAAFAVLYYSGIPFVRVPAFALGSLSILFIAYKLMM